VRTVNYSLYFLCLYLLLITAVQAEAIDEIPADADFLEFLAEVDEATGDGFEQWLETETAADTAIDTDEEKK